MAPEGCAIRMQIEVVPEEQLGPRAADSIAGQLTAAVVARGEATIAFSGGSGVARLLRPLAQAAVPWRAIHVFQVDERVAPDGHSDRNFTLLRELLLDPVGIEAGQVHPMAVTEPDLERAAADYARAVTQIAGDPPVFDVVHLGLGADGHTASLLPGTQPMKDRGLHVAATPPYRGRRRMTLTAPTLSRARHVVWLVSGGAKAHAVRRLVQLDAALPASQLGSERAVLMLDPSAAAELPAADHL